MQRDDEMEMDESIRMRYTPENRYGSRVIKKKDLFSASQ